jgi:hypothetical protein
MLGVKHSTQCLLVDTLNAACKLNLAFALYHCVDEMDLTLTVPENPFRPGAGTKPLYLAGRSHEQTTFIKALKQSALTQNLLITGLRGVGKTVLLEEFRPLAPQHGWLWTGNDWNEAAAVSEKDVATRLIVDLTAALAPIVHYRVDELPLGFADRTCKTCRYFGKGKGGSGHRAMVLLMAATGNRFSPSSTDMASIMVTDKHGQCLFNPEGVAKYQSDFCGQWAEKTPER